MASPPSAAAKTSRWGSFLTGIESRLDTILADEDVSSKPKADGARSEVAEKKAGSVGLKAPSERPDGLARTASINRAQDRLNERLAKAMANRNGQRAGDSSAAPSNLPSRTATPANVATSPRPSTDLQRDEANTSDKGISESSSTVNQEQDGCLQQQTEAPITKPSELAPIETQATRMSVDPTGSISTWLSIDQDRKEGGTVELPQANGHTVPADPKIPEQHESTIFQLRTDYEAAELRRQEETHDFLERIDALQSKLQYLSKEAAETAKRASSSAEFGSPEQKVAAKDEKIALLIEEGQKLSQTELKHMSIIKKLRGKSTEDEKTLVESKRLAEKHDKDARESQERAKRAEAAERRATERTKSLPRLEKDLESLRSERDLKVVRIESLQRQLSEAQTVAKEAEGKAHAEALEVEKRRTSDLVDELSRLKSENEIAEKRYLTEICELKEKAERDKERARIAEVERQGEQNILESRLEALRARAEEASAGGTENVQAKLLRQIETLQNQYAVASENWQGIEGSLLARVTTLERERDEISKREADVRRKARETNLKLRRIEEDLERATAGWQDTQHELTQQTSQLASLQDKLSRTEGDVAEARKDLQSQRETWEAREAQRIEEEKARQRDELARATDALDQRFRTDSPLTSGRTRKSSNADRGSPHGRRYQGLALSGSGLERPISRRSSTQPLRSADTRPASRQDSAAFTHHTLTNGTVPETPSITVGSQDEFFDGVQTPVSPEHTINDMISASTAAAGPSVQLVERMSAAVRRLESEKASLKDELARLSQQRDEARDQVVNLMREADEKSKVDERIKILERENEVVQERYSTTLEMLGEKSEKVEELKADVADLKQMYRDLVDNTMK